MSYFILKVPKVSIKNYFTKDVIFFILLWVILVVSILICMWGYKYFQSLAVIILGAIGGGIGMKFLDVVPQPIVKAFLFAIFAMMAVCLAFAGSILVQKVLDLLRLRKPLARIMPVLTSILGAGFAAILVYTRIFAFLPAVIGLFLVLVAGGTIHQIRSRKKTPEFHTYADLLKLQPEIERVAEND